MVTGELKLLAAVVESAIDDLRPHLARRVRYAAYSWLVDLEATDALGFPTVADHLGLNAEAIARRVRRQYGPIAPPPPPPRYYRHAGAPPKSFAAALASGASYALLAEQYGVRVWCIMRWAQRVRRAARRQVAA